MHTHENINSFRFSPLRHLHIALYRFQFQALLKMALRDFSFRFSFCFSFCLSFGLTESSSTSPKGQVYILHKTIKQGFLEGTLRTASANLKDPLRKKTVQAGKTVVYGNYFCYKTLIIPLIAITFNSVAQKQKKCYQTIHLYSD